MKVIGDLESVNLSTGETYQRVAGNGESRLVCLGRIDEPRLGPQRDHPMFGPTAEEIIRRANQILKGRNMNATRCKVRLVSISGGYYSTDKGRTVEFRAVNDGSEENKKFFAATPSAEFKINLSAEAALALGLDQGKIGSEFYVDFSPAA